MIVISIHDILYDNEKVLLQLLIIWLLVMSIYDILYDNEAHCITTIKYHCHYRECHHGLVELQVYGYEDNSY
jgi:hypothetical protein